MKAKTKKPVKTPKTQPAIKGKSIKLTALQKVKFFNFVYFYLNWVGDNEDLVDHYVLDETIDEDKLVEEISEPEELPKDQNSEENAIPEANTKTRNIYFKNPKVLFIAFLRRKGLIRALATLAVITLLVMVIQILYPSNRALPLSSLQSVGYVGFSDKSQVLSKLSDFDQRIVTVHTHNKNITTAYKDIGVAIDPVATADSLSNYSMSKRLVPFSIFFPREGHAN